MHRQASGLQVFKCRVADTHGQVLWGCWCLHAPAGVQVSLLMFKCGVHVLACTSRQSGERGITWLVGDSHATEQERSQGRERERRQGPKQRERERAPSPGPRQRARQEMSGQVRENEKTKRQTDKESQSSLARRVACSPHHATPPCMAELKLSNTPTRRRCGTSGTGCSLEPASGWPGALGRG